MPKHRRKATLDDGCNPELLIGADFDGALEMPMVHAPSPIVIPYGFTPYSRISHAPTKREMICFFENDLLFADILINPQAHLQELARAPMMTQVDCSLYRDMPLMAQLINIYRSRSIASYYQRSGLVVWPLVRWGDERTYTDELFPEPPAFCGIEKRSPVVVSGYGCQQGTENRFHFEAGLETLVDFIQPCLILLYGTSVCHIKHIQTKAEIILYPDWTSRMKGGE